MPSAATRGGEAMPLCRKRMSRICTSAYSQRHDPHHAQLAGKTRAGCGALALIECHTHTTSPTNSATPSSTPRTWPCTAGVSQG